MTAPFTACVLCYGDYPALAERALLSLLRNQDWFAEIRVGLNAVSSRTGRYVDDLHEAGQVSRVYEHAANVYKYPVMREMLYDPQHPITTPYLLWLDDDSSLGMVGATVLPALLAKLRQADLVGEEWHKGLEGRQREWLQRQWWYRQQPVAKSPSFITGGLWAARCESLYALNYPWPELRHRGGDVLLSVALRQQGRQIANYRYRGLLVNASMQGKNADSPRRGYNERPLGARPEDPDTSPPAGWSVTAPGGGPTATVSANPFPLADLL